MHVLGFLEHRLLNLPEDLQHIHPDGLQIHEPNTNNLAEFPRLQILDSQAGQMLLAHVVDDILTHGLPGFPVWTLKPEDRQELFKYITVIQCPLPRNSPKLGALLSSNHIQNILLLLKGLFAHGIMLFVFQQKRWRVTYGHDFSRSNQAVPYRAKDLPSPRSSFSHPDVTILLTCLSYYYAGLSDEQLNLCFKELLASDNPEGEYDAWTSKNDALLPSLRKLSGINLKDGPQCVKDLFPHLRRSKVVIDFFMARLVFPEEMKEFPQKLSSSGWDIARLKQHPVTGFSGTNDSRHLLPLSISQADIPDQVHTNAKVLNCLLQSRNTYSVIPNAGDTTTFLNLVVSAVPQVRVVLDAGALVIDWHNDEMAREWLKRVQSLEVEAVVYFDDEDELVVLTRDGRVQLLQESPMLRQMDKCLVYLDDAHTRGTDLKLPSDYRAAVTLGPGLSKDRLVQGNSLHPNCVDQCH